ncbi:MAG TPA: Asp-tRNA(Asn)/Glu-tRNA(Gln) amidotransferase subunit GatB [Chlamydiales bacterium]|nr:Asp-tRNA(Asn)/Glu-tRNA(Gln) amidotransferase subunit GatB [Chlamydiales bacterium]
MKDLPFDLWEPIIGLEIHAQLKTKSKLFSSAPNAFGNEPNTNISIVCTGQPGALPVLNEEVVKKAVQLGIALKAKISMNSTFDRKSYFYPDSPRNFQITQFENPIIQEGIIVTDTDGITQSFEIREAHIEDDTGMLRHFSKFTGIDYNRAGVPLIEIVSTPCMHSAHDAISYATTLKAILEYLDVSDCNMEDGHLRMDVNISVRPKNEEGLRPKTEIKNVNSFSNMEIAINEEVQRQIALYTSHPNEPFETIMPQSTYRFDTVTKKLVLMRRKESADDYRYFPEPDLLPIKLTKEYIEELEQTLPELPHERFKRYKEKLELSDYDASLLINNKKLSDYFEQALECYQNPKAICNWITVEFVGRLKDKTKSVLSFNIPPKHIANLVEMIDKKIITGKIAKKIADDMICHPEIDPYDIAKENPEYQPMSDETALQQIVEEVVSENPQSIIDFHNGKDRAFGFLVGQVMKKTKGKASPEVVNKLLKKSINEKK